MARGSEVGSAYVSIYPDTSTFTRDLASKIAGADIEGSTVSAGKKAGDGFSRGFSASTVALGNIISTAVMGAVDVFTANLDRGIKRLDTIRNFPRLMEQFGFSSESAAAAVQQVQNHLDGLPGSTDEVLRLIQAISDSTGTLDLATSTGLAFNDMLTAAGADATTAAMATRMFDQMMGGAEFTTQRWYGITSKMPLQMKMVAQSLLGTGATVEDLGNALSDGTVSMTDLAQAMSDLGPEFENQARAMSFGIGTALTNVQNKASAGVAAILDAVGQEKIAGAITGFGEGIRGAMEFAAGGIGWLADRIEESNIGELLGEIAGNVKEWFENIDWEPLKQFADEAIKLVEGALQWLVDNGPLVESVIHGILTVVIAFVVGDYLTKIATGLTTLFGIIMANPLGALVVVIAAVASGLYYFFTQTEEGREIWENFTTALREAWEKLTNKLKELWDKIKKWFSDLGTNLKNTVDKIKTNITNAWNKIKTNVTNVVNTIKGIIEKVWNTIKGIIDTVVNGIRGTVTNGFNGVKNTASTIFGGIKSVASTAWNGIKSTIGGVLDGIKSAGSNAWESMKTTAGNVWNGIKSTVSTTANGLKTALDTSWSSIKGAASTAWENIKSAISNPISSASSTVRSTVGSMQGSINGLTGKKVEVGVSDTRGKVSSIVKGIQSSINSVYGKTVTVSVRKGGISGINVRSKAAGGGWYLETYASGGIATGPTLGIFGEAGSEALVPLSNRSKVRPFANAVASEIDESRHSKVIVTGNAFYVRNDGDIRRIAQEISDISSRQMAGRL